MITHPAGRLLFHFKPDGICHTLDAPDSFHVKQFQDTKAKSCDFLYIRNGAAYLIEASDYAHTGATNPDTDNLRDEVAEKLLGTCAALTAGCHKNSKAVDAIKADYRAALDCELVLVFHLHKAPRNIDQLENLEYKIKRLTRKLGIKFVLCGPNVPNRLPWSVTRAP